MLGQRPYRMKVADAEDVQGTHGLLSVYGRIGVRFATIAREIGLEKGTHWCWPKAQIVHHDALGSRSEMILPDELHGLWAERRGLAA